MLIKYFIRTTKERTLDESFSQIQYELLIDSNHKPVESFIDQLEYISDYDAVLLEDDVKLCKDFKSEIEKVISEHPNDIINFFTNPDKYFTSHYSQSFLFNQCTYYPKGIGKLLSHTMRDIFANSGQITYDVLEGRAIKNNNLWVYQYRPCLVEHMDGYSLIDKTTFHNIKRTTPFFKDFLDKHNIDYNNPSEVFKNIDTLREELKNLLLSYKLL